MELSQGRLQFKLVVTSGGGPEVTAYAGLPLVIEAADAMFTKAQYKALRDALGYEAWKVVQRHVQSVLVLVAAGGECIDDLDTLRADPGLSALLGFELSSPTQVKDFLYRFHQAEDGRLLSKQDDAELTVVGRAQIRAEGPGLRALAKMGEAVVERLQMRSRQMRATLDVDATIVEAHKRQALVAYEGTRGYQPQMAWWAEHQLWVCDEFRDGNVPAAFAVLDFLKKAFGRLPCTVQERRLRADSALYDEDALTWAGDVARIQFAVSADMSEQLLAAVKALPEESWNPYRTLRDNEKVGPETEEREWAEVEFVPDWNRNRKKKGTPFRYLSIRVRPRQRDLLVPDEGRWRHFAVVTNMDWEGERLLRWHREKQGTVEHGHGVLKNELAGGTLPCGKFGANAAWWRLNVLAQGVLQFLKAEALPQAMQALRPKALRFRLFNIAGRLVHHSRQVCLYVSERLPTAKVYAQARAALLNLAAVSPAPVPTG